MKPRPNTLLVVEHRLVTITHATVNAALLLAMRHALPGARVVFAAAPPHASFVEEVLRVHGEGLGRSGLEFQPVRAPRPPDDVGRSRFLIDRARMLRTLTRLFHQLRPGGALYCSAAVADPLFIGRLLGRAVPALVVIHELNRLARPSSDGRLLRHALRSARTKALRFVVLGPSILAGLRGIDPTLARRFCAIPLPCLAPPMLSRAAERRAPLRFGRLGGDGRGGARTFLELARAVHRRTPGARFVMVGSTGTRIGRPDARANVEGYSETPLSYAEYCRRAASLDYAIWVGDPANYQLTASASVIDAVAFARPLIALRNPFTQWLFDTFGNIGRLCADSNEMVEAIVSCGERGLTPEYFNEVARLRRAQAQLSVHNVGNTLRERFEELGCIPAPAEV